MWEVTLNVSGDVELLGIELAYSATLGVPVIASLSAFKQLLQIGDAIESVNNIILEPGLWKDSQQQLCDALLQRSLPQQIKFVRGTYDLTSVQLVPLSST